MKSAMYRVATPGRKTPQHGRGLTNAAVYGGAVLGMGEVEIFGVHKGKGPRLLEGLS